MRRVAPTIPVSPDMLRHFAALTLVITAGLAMFASGEGQQVIAEQVQQRELRTQQVRMDRQEAQQQAVVVDGLRLAPGTRLGAADVDTPHFDTEGLSGPMQTSAYRAAAPAGAGPGASGPQGLVLDANGTVIPPPAGQMRQRPKPGQPQAARAPRRLTQEDVDAIEAASAARAGTPRSE